MGQATYVSPVPLSDSGRFRVSAQQENHSLDLLSSGMIDQGDHEGIPVWKVVHQTRLRDAGLVGHSFECDGCCAFTAPCNAQASIQDLGSLALAHDSNYTIRKVKYGHRVRRRR